MNAKSPSKHTFHYHASAHALSGQFWRPFQRVIEVQAPSVLPGTGGIGNSRVDNFRLDDLVSFKAGYTHVLGSEMEMKDDKGLVVKDTDGKPGIAYTTQVTSTVEGLNILDVVTADRIVARLTSVHDARDRQSEAKIILIGSRFENLRITGCDVHVSLHHQLFLELETFGSIRSLKGDSKSDFWKLATETLEAAHPGAKLDEKQPEGHGALLCSIVKDVKFKCLDEDEKVCPGVTRSGRHRLHVREFGNVYLGEVLFQRGQKTLTMLRIELGSPHGAGLTVVQADSNGRPWPPTP